MYAINTKNIFQFDIIKKNEYAKSFVNCYDKHCARIKELEVTKPRVCCLLTRALSKNINAIISLSKLHYYKSIYIYTDFYTSISRNN